MRRAVVKVGAEILGQVLFDDTAIVHAVRSVDGDTHTVELLIEHPDLADIADDQVAPEVDCIVTHQRRIFRFAPKA